MTSAGGGSRETLEIVDFVPQHARAFHDLNIDWLERYFSVEPIDRKVLSDPKTYLVDPGGAVLMACLGDHAVGCCALKFHAGTLEYELTKMAVTPGHQGRGIGAQLMQAVIDRYQASPGQGLFLETNSILEPAIRLYRGFGFVRQPDRRPGSPYLRSNVYMIWDAEAMTAERSG